VPNGATNMVSYTQKEQYLNSGLKKELNDNLKRIHDRMLQEEKDDVGGDYEHRTTVEEEEETEDDVDYTEKFTLKMQAGWTPPGQKLWRVGDDWDRTVEMKFEGQYLGEILDQFKTFMKACGFSYVTKLTASTAVGEDYESEEDI